MFQHLNRQVEALDKLTKLTDSIKERASEPADRRLRCVTSSKCFSFSPADGAASELTQLFFDRK
jgi:hypothetical protein